MYQYLSIYYLCTQRVRHGTTPSVRAITGTTSIARECSALDGNCPKNIRSKVMVKCTTFC